MRTQAFVPASLILLTLVVSAGILVPAPTQAAGLSLRYGGQGVWPQTATANSQRWFRSEVTYDAAINDDGVPNERIDRLYLSGVTYSEEQAALSGDSYREGLSSPGNIWSAGRVSSTGAWNVTLYDPSSDRKKIYYSCYESFAPGALNGYELRLTSGLGYGTGSYVITGNSVDFNGTYLTLEPANPLNPLVCPTLNVVDHPSATRVYYKGAEVTAEYPARSLEGMTLRFTKGVAAGQNFTIDTNNNDPDGYYIDVTEDLPDGMLPTLTVTQVVSPTRFYYIGGTYADDALIGQSIKFLTPPSDGQQRVITDNGTVAATGETWIETTVLLPADLLKSLTVTDPYVADSKKFYYSGQSYAAGALNGLTLEFDTIGGVAPATPTVMTIDSNGADGGGAWITVTEDLPGGLAVSDTFHVRDQFQLQDQMHVNDRAQLVDAVHANDKPEYYGVAWFTVGPGDYVLTVGPFSEYHWEYLVGQIPLTGSAPDPNFKFKLYWSKWKHDEEAPGGGYYESQDPLEVGGTQITVPLALSSYVGGWLCPSGEMQAWHSGQATGVDPLTVTRSAPGGPTDPDNGSGSDTYTFRIKYFSGLDGWPELRSCWRRYTTPSEEFGEEYNFCDFDRFVYKLLTTGVANPDYKSAVGDGGGKDWMYGTHQDPHYDLIGDSVAGGNDPHAVLILDDAYDRPYYMMPESGDRLRTGLVYKYDVQPSNYLQLVHNALLLAYDPLGRDTWDTAYWTMTGKPTSNAYVSMRAGGHTYQLLTCRDWDPPVWEIYDAGATPRVGPCSLVLQGMPGNSLNAIHLVNDWNTAQRYVAAVPEKDWEHDLSPGGYGYPYDSQDPYLYPKGDPLLTAQPYFEEGPRDAAEQGYPSPWHSLGDLGPMARGALANPFNPLPSTLTPQDWTGPVPGANLGDEPWGDMVGPTDSGVAGGYGAGGNSSLRFTNDDTLWPNLVNIWDDTVLWNPDLTQRSAYRGGKWTTNTTFVFRINYWQSENLSPQFTQIFIRKTDAAGTPTTSWQGYSMQKVYPSDTNYDDGCVYYYQASASELPGGGGPGDYQYYFSCNDGRHTAIYPNRPSDDPGYLGVPPGDNDWYWFRVNRAPTLSNQSVTPASGNQGDNFVFKVSYRDQDGMVRSSDPQGDRPFKAFMHIDLFGDVRGQMQVKSVDASTITYDFLPPVPDGGGNPYPEGDLFGMEVYFQTGTAAGQELVITGNTAAAGQGTITISGTLPVGVAAGDKFQIVDWFDTLMDPVDPGDTNYFNGAEFTFDTARAGVTLDPGMHNYYFEFWDNWAYWINWDQYFMASGVTPPDLKVEGEIVRLPAIGYFEGPEVIRNQAPWLSKFYFAPPATDTVDSVDSVDTFSYTRPGGLSGYTSNLAEKYLQFQSGLAQFQVFQIVGNTTSQIQVLTSLTAAGVNSGDTFRVFEHYSAAGLSWAHHPAEVYDGTPATGFLLYINYTDFDNDPPSSIRLGVYYGEDPYNPDTPPDAVCHMVKVLADDNTYADGCEYVTDQLVYLPQGQNYLRAQAYDGALWAEGGNAAKWFGPAASPDPTLDSAVGPRVAVNTPPVLGFPVGNGTANTIVSATQFTYNSTNLNSDPIVAVDFGGGNKFRVLSHNPLTSTITLVSGSDLIAAGITPGDPFVATVGLDPTSGFTDTTYTYWVVYTDNDIYGGLLGNPPSFVKVFIDGDEYLMQAYDPTDTDMTDGKVYFYQTSSLSASQSHSYYFIASDGTANVRLPVASASPNYFSGPTIKVNNAPLPPPYPPATGWSPISGATLTNASPTLNWLDGLDNDPWDSPDTFHYIVQLSQDDAFGTVDYEYDITDFGGPGITTLDVPAVLSSGVWYWRVMTVDQRGLQSVWSDTQSIDQSFQIVVAPNPPTSGFVPTGEISTTIPLLQWDPGSDPGSTPEADLVYHVVVDDNSDFSSPVIGPNQGVTAAGVTEFQVDAAVNLQRGPTYYWRVRTVISPGGTPIRSAWSTTQSFVIVTNRAPSPPPSGFDPSGGEVVTTAKPTFSWEAGSDPDPEDTPDVLSYQLELDTDNDWRTWDNAYGRNLLTVNGGSDTTGLGETQKSLTKIDLVDNTRYWWRIRTYDSHGMASAWSATFSFWMNTDNDPPNPPGSGFSPNNGVTVNTATPTLRWDAASDPDPGDSVVSYIVQLSRDAFAGGVFDYEYTTDSNLVDVVTPLTDLTTWSWRVKSVDGQGAQSVWSLVQDFYVDLQKEPPTLGPPDGDPSMSLVPLVGGLTTNFQYTVVYTNIYNEPPGGAIYVVIDAVQYPTPLAKTNPTDNDYTDGVEYAITIRGDDAALGSGKHEYRFRCGAVAWPADGDDPGEGPWVISPLIIGDATYTEVDEIEEGDTLYLEVLDDDQNVDALTVETVLAEVVVVGGIDREEIVLTETGPNTGLFRGSIPTLGEAGAQDDGVVNVIAGPSGTMVRATYTNPDFIGSPVPAVATDSVLVVDTVAPPKVQPFLTEVAADHGMSIVLDWSTYVPPVDLTGYHVWFKTTFFNNVSGLTALATVPAGQTTYTITGVTPDTTYFVAVTGFDEIPNENFNADSHSLTPTDTVGPDLSDQTPAPGATEVPLDATISFRLSDLSGVDLSRIQVFVRDADVTAQCSFDPDVGTPDSVLVEFSRNYTWNQLVIVRVLAQDTLGKPSDDTWQFTTITDLNAPQVTDLNPPEGATGVLPANPISFHLFDAVSGVEVSTIRVLMDGDDITGDLQIDASDLNEVVVTYAPAGGLPSSATPEFTISASDRAGKDMVPFVWHFTTLAAFQFSLPAGISMVGVPFDPLDRNPVTVFGTTQVRRWNPLATPAGYMAPGAPGSQATLEVRPGRGYFVNYAVPHDLTGSGIPVSTATPYVISFGPDWNMIANPFAAALPLANLRPALPGGVTPYAFIYDGTSGSYVFVSAQPGLNVARTYLKPWEGAWVRSLVGITSLTATAPVGPTGEGLVEPQALDVGSEGYVIPIVAEAAGRADLCSAAGVSARGEYKILNPPTAPGGVDLYFVDETGNLLAQELKPASAAQKIWNFVVATDIANAEVAVRLPDLSQVPNELSVTLVDEDASRSVYMRTTSQYVFRSGPQGAVRHFHLEIAPQSSENDLVITAASAQQSAGGVVLTYSVSRACQMQATVMNIAGRVVRRLGTEQVGAAGVNTLVWNLRNEYGATVPAGMYLMRVEAIAESGQRVQALTPVSVTR